MLLHSSMAADENIFFLAAFLCRNLPLAVCNSCSVTINSSWIALCCGLCNKLPTHLANVLQEALSSGDKMSLGLNCGLGESLQ